MRVLSKCCVAIALNLCALPLVAQVDAPTESSDSQERLALDTNALAVLPVEILTTDPRAPTVATAVYEALLNQLASIEGVYVVGSDRVLPYADSTLPPEEIARLLGVGSIVDGSIHIGDGMWQTRFRHVDAQSGNRLWQETIFTPVYSLGRPIAPDKLDQTAGLPRFAETVEYWLYPERIPNWEQLRAEARASFLNSSLSDNERLDALIELVPTKVGPPIRYREGEVKQLWGPVAVAAAQLATEADDPNVRARVWWTMTTVGDPYLIQPLLYSLANDGDPNVRRAAVEALKDFLDEPDVRYALEYAGETDASELVRSESRFSLLSEAEQQEESRATVLDITRTDEDRLSAALELILLIDFNPNVLSREIIIAIADLARESDNSRIREDAWVRLAWTGDTYVAQSLLEALTTDPDEHVRRTVSNALSEFPNHPGVREALEEALANDTSPLVRYAAEKSLESVSLNR